MAALGVLRAWAGAGAGRRRPARAGRLGRRGGRALRPQPASAARRSRARLDPARGRGRYATPAGARIADGAGRERRRPRRGPRECAAPPRGPRRLPGAAHRAGAACWRRRACAPRRSPAAPGSSGMRFEFSRPGLARGDDADGRAPRRRARRRRGGARDRADPGRRGRVWRRPASCGSSPGSSTAVAGRAGLAVDLRHPEPEPLARMLAAAREARAGATSPRRGCAARRRRRCGGSSRSPFDTGLVSRRAPPAPRSPASPRASPAARSTTPPRSPGCCRQR